MSDELQQKIMSLIDGAETVIPEVAQEYLAWGVMVGYIGLFIGLIIIIVSSIAFYKGMTAKPESSIYKNDLEFGFIMGGAIFLILGFLLVGDNAYDIIKIKTAPKVYLIDALRSK